MATGPTVYIPSMGAWNINGYRQAGMPLKAPRDAVSGTKVSPGWIGENSYKLFAPLASSQPPTQLVPWVGPGMQPGMHADDRQVTRTAESKTERRHESTLCALQDEDI